MNNYIIFINNKEIAKVSGCEAAYTCFEAAKVIAEMTCQIASLVWEETCEVVGYFDPEYEGEVELEYMEPDDIDDDCGFDPYEGCYTYDC